MATMIIEGERTKAVSGKTYEVRNPATGEVVDVVPAGGPADVDKAAQAAAKTFATWSKLAPAKRAGILRQSRAPHAQQQGGADRSHPDQRAGQDAARVEARGPALRREHRLVCGSRGQGARPARLAARHHDLRPGHPHADRSVRRDSALELSAHPGGEQGCACDRSRQHGRPQTGQHDAYFRPLRVSRRSSRAACRKSRPRRWCLAPRQERRDGRPPDHPQDRSDRFDPDWQEGDGSSGRN